MTARPFATVEQTRLDARALLAKPVSDDDHVAADRAEDRGDDLTAHRLRNLPSFTGANHEGFTIDRKYLTPTMRGINPWMLLVAVYADEEENVVVGHDCFGVHMGAVTEEVFGESFADWCQVRFAPRRTQEALVLLIIAEIRERRAVCRVVQGLAA